MSSARARYGGVRLHPHGVRAAELVEVVRVQAAEVDLHRVEDVRHRHAQLLRLGAVDVGVQLRHVDLEAREHAGELGRCVGLGHEGLERGVHAVDAHRAAVFQLQLEAAGRADALHRRRREHHDEGFLDAGELLVQLLRDRAGAQVRALALVEVGFSDTNTMPELELLVKPLIDRPGNCDGVLDARLLGDDVAHLADHLLGAVERGAVGQLREADQVLLVLRRHEAARHGLEQAQRRARPAPA